MNSIKAITDQAARELRAYAAEMNINERLIDDMLVVQPENVRWLSAEERQSYGLGFLDRVYEEAGVLEGAKKYNITPAEYRACNSSAQAQCGIQTEDELYGILEGKRSKCSEKILSNFFCKFDR
jgi:hypothetical protein